MSSSSSNPGPQRLQIFAPASSAPFGRNVARALDVELAPLEERDFEGGEHKIRPLVSVRSRQVYVIQSLQGDRQHSANDKLCRLAFFVGALKDCGAARVTVCMPYLAYARKDRRTKMRDPVTLRYVAQMLEAVGVDHVMALDVHNVAAFQNAFRCQTDHLEAAPVFARHYAAALGSEPLTVASPDVGGIKRAQRLQGLLARELGRDVAIAFLDKRRSAGVVSGELLAGEVEGRRVIVLDDLISGGTTMLRATDACRRAGATAVEAVATHAVFGDDARRLFGPEGPDRLLVTDSVPLRTDLDIAPGRMPLILSASELYAEAIRRAESGASVAELAELE